MHNMLPTVHNPICESMMPPAHKVKAMEVNGASVLSLLELLLQVISEPHNAPAGLREACKSQGKLAKFSCQLAFDGSKSLTVSPMSLNTMKKTADRVVVPGGFQKLDHIRCDALMAFSTQRTKGSQLPEPNDGASSGVEISEIRMRQFANSVSDFAERYNDLLRITQNIIRRASEGKFNRANEERLLKEHLAQSLALPRPYLKIVNPASSS